MAEGLKKQIKTFEFILSIVIWYDLLVAVNRVSKTLQSPSMCLDVCNTMLNNLLLFFQEFRDTGFENALQVAKQIAIENNINPSFEDKRVPVVPRQFDYQSRGSRPPNQTPEDRYRTDYFYVIVDKARVSFQERLKQFQEYSDNFGFLYDTLKLKSLSLDQLKKHCNDLDLLLRSGEMRDIEGDELYNELRFLRPSLPNNVPLTETLKYV